MPAKNLTLSKKPSLMHLTWPIFIELLMASLTGIVDQIMISQYDEPALATIGTGNTIILLFILTFSVFSLATTILISQYIGAEKKETLSTIYSLAIAVNAILGVVVSAILVIFASPIAEIMNVPPSQYENFCGYVRITGGFLFTQAIFSTFTAILKSNAVAKPIMIISVSMNIVNIGLNYVLMYGIGSFPELGIVGAAIATVTSRILAVIMIIVFYTKTIRTKISIKKLIPFPKQILKSMLKIGLPSGGETVSYNFTQIIIIAWINGFGEVQSTSKFYVTLFVIVSCMFSNAITQASQILVGYHIGAKNYDAAKKQTNRTLFIAITVSGFVAFILWLLSPAIMNLLTDNPEIVKLVGKILLIDIFLEMGRAINVTMVRALQAAGDTVFPIIIGIISTWVLAVGLSAGLGIGLGIGLIGVWIAMASDEIIRGIIFIFRWHSGAWKNKDFVT